MAPAPQEAIVPTAEQFAIRQQGQHPNGPMARLDHRGTALARRAGVEIADAAVAAAAPDRSIGKSDQARDSALSSGQRGHSPPLAPHLQGAVVAAADEIAGGQQPQGVHPAVGGGEWLAEPAALAPMVKRAIAGTADQVTMAKLNQAQALDLVRVSLEPAAHRPGIPATHHVLVSTAEAFAATAEHGPPVLQQGHDAAVAAVHSRQRIAFPIPLAQAAVISPGDEATIGHRQHGTHRPLATGQRPAAGFALMPPAQGALTPAADPVAVGQHRQAPHLVVSRGLRRPQGATAATIPVAQHAIAATAEQLAIVRLDQVVQLAVAGFHGLALGLAIEPALQQSLVASGPPLPVAEGHQAAHPHRVAGLEGLPLPHSSGAPDLQQAIASPTDQAAIRRFGQAPHFIVAAGPGCLQAVALHGAVEADGQVYCRIQLAAQPRHGRQAVHQALDRIALQQVVVGTQVLAGLGFKGPPCLQLTTQPGAAGHQCQQAEAGDHQVLAPASELFLAEVVGLACLDEGC